MYQAPRSGLAGDPSHTVPLHARPLRLACVGHAAIDHVFGIEAFAQRPTKTPASSYCLRGGGMAFNAALAAARLGASVRLIGRVGDDLGADFLRAQLQAEGVEPRGLQSVVGASTSVAAVVVDAQGQRQVFNHRGTALARAHALDLRQLAGADAVLVDPRWVAGAETALRWARRQGVLCVLDADVAPQADLQRLVPLADWAVFSESGLACYAPGLGQDEAMRRAVHHGCRVALVTRGEWGSRRTEGDGFADCPAPPVLARDTTAAGDVFHGALALALAGRQTVDAALRYASAAAAFKCARGQGVLGAPTRAELVRWMARLPARFSRGLD